MKLLALALIVFLPGYLLAQNGVISFDFNKGHKVHDSIASAPNDIEENNDDSVATPAKQKIQHPVKKLQPAIQNTDYKRAGIFKGLFHAGFNACQIDGDPDYFPKYLGAEFGLGALARFHRLLSVSAELNYSMKGARARLIPNPNADERYQVQWDYVEVPVGLNIHYKNWLMFSVGISTGYMVRYKELDDFGRDVTNHPVLGQPRRVDLCGFGGVHFIIKNHYALGFKFNYSMLKIREPYSGTKVNGEYNNYLTFRFMYILSRRQKT
ncbi:MAG TPA: outer membrane beta-barrel protein [Chitinophagales bacterium]|nr:outer membrane beta-barrel protein [Chitinophagales bacterium]